MSHRFIWGARTDVGRVREINQDSLHAQDGLFIVADGMGGHRGGEVASAVAIETMLDGGTASTTIETLVARVQSANEAIIERSSRDVELAGMGTTLCAVALIGAPGQPEASRVGIINVGDSRVYRFAGGRLAQITQDHSLVETLVREGRISPDDAADHPQRNILTRALGIADEVQVDSWVLPAEPGDQFLLCSDGLFNEVPDVAIAATMRRLAEPDAIVDELVRLANESGSRDNVTVVIAQVTDEVGDRPAVDAGAGRASTAPVTAEVPVTRVEPAVSPRHAAAPTGPVTPVRGVPIVETAPTQGRRWWKFWGR